MMTSAKLLSRASLGSLLAVTLFAASPAHATDVEGCVKAAELGQAARRSDALLKARGHLLSCARETCPAVIRSDCARWLDDVEARLPAASVRVTGDDGRDVAAKVTIDGAPSSDPSGKSIQLDPGSHTFRAEAEGFETAEQKAVLAQGEKARVVTLILRSKNALAPAGPAGPPKEEQPKGPSPFVYPVGSLGVLGLVGFTYFGLSGRSQASDLRDGCGKTSSCAQEDVDSASGKYLIADISLTIGLVALGAAAIIWLATTP